MIYSYFTGRVAKKREFDEFTLYYLMFYAF